PAAPDQPPEPAEQRVEVDVPDPGHVTAVGDAVVERDEEDRRRPRVDQRPDDLVGAGRVLDQEEQQALAADVDPLETAESWRSRLEPAGDLVERRAQRMRE